MTDVQAAADAVAENIAQLTQQVARLNTELKSAQGLLEDLSQQIIGIFTTVMICVISVIGALLLISIVVQIVGIVQRVVKARTN